MTDQPDPETGELELVTQDRAPAPMMVTDRQATALAATARAMVQARVFMARQNPRSMPAVFDRMVQSLKRPSFAEKAVFRIKRGKVQNGDGQWIDNYIEGPSIRLAESLRLAMGNIGTEDVIVADDDESRTVAVTAIDYESNSSQTVMIQVQKRVEKKGFKDRNAPGGWKPPDREVISWRKNSYGDPVYLCVATDDEVMEIQNRNAAKARRNCILSIVPADLREDCVNQAKAVAVNAAAANRIATIASLKGKFAKRSIKQEEIALYLGKSIDEASADELAGLSMLAVSLDEGQTTWKEVMKARAEAVAAEQEPEDEKPAVAKKRGGAAIGSAIDAVTKQEPKP